MPVLRAIMNPYVPLQALFEAPLELSDGATVVFEPTSAVGGAAAAAARMLRLVPGFDFEIGELPIINYLSARDTGIPISAIPVFLTRRFCHSLIFRGANSGVEHPKDLEGKRVGVGYWGHSDTTWTRGVLAESYGVDLDSITWVTFHEEQVPKGGLPPEFVHIPRLDLDQMMMSGEIAGAIHHYGKSIEPSASPSITHLLPNWENDEKQWFKDTGIFPILHVVVIKNSVLDEHPSLASELFAAFVKAKAAAFDRIRRGETLSESEKASAIHSGFPIPALAHLGPDPMPYGVEPNRHNLETLIRMAYNQHVLSKPPAVEQVMLPCG